MLEKAYDAQCAACENCAKVHPERRQHQLALFSLALGSFCIGSSEFASMGILQLFAAALGVDIPTATHAIAAYALGVVAGGPLVTLAAARLNRRSLLLALIGLFVVGNLMSSLAPNMASLVVARFISGVPQGAYFGGSIEKRVGYRACGLSAAKSSLPAIKKITVRMVARRVKPLARRLAAWKRPLIASRKPLVCRV
jgi:predicted MFS family arabinose efflux permease